MESPSTEPAPTSPSTEVSDKDKFIISALNVQGSFFHKKCIEVIASQPTFRVIEKEFPIQIKDQFTKIDIVGERSGNAHNFFIFECKKVDNEFKSWVFFPDVKHGQHDRSVYHRKNFKQPLILDSFLNTGEYGHPNIELLKYFITPTDGASAEIGSDMCYDAYQIKLDYDKDGKINPDNIPKAAKKDDIEKACNQVLLGSRGYAFHRRDKNANRPGFIVPIVVTTAKLLACDVSSADIDLNEGIVKDYSKIKLRPVDWVVYNYKPNFMLDRDNNISIYSEPKSNHYGIESPSNESDSLDYTMSVYVVNIAALGSFLDKIQWLGM